MPLDLTKQKDLDALIQGTAQKVSAKLFDSALTGSGKGALGYFHQDYATMADFKSAGRLGIGIPDMIEVLSDEYELIHAGLDWFSPIADNLRERQQTKAAVKLVNPPDLFDLTQFAKTWTPIATLSNQTSIYFHYQLPLIAKKQTTVQGAVGPHTETSFNFGALYGYLIAPTAMTSIGDTLYLANLDDFWLTKDFGSFMATHTDAPILLMSNDGINATLDNIDDTVAMLKSDLNLSANLRLRANGVNYLNQPFNDHDVIPTQLQYQAEHLTQNLADDTKSALAQLRDVLVSNYPAANQVDLYHDIALAYVRNFSQLERLIPNYITSQQFRELYQLLDTIQTKAIKLPPSQFSQLTSTNLRLLLSQNLSKLAALHQNNLLYQFKPQNNMVDARVHQATNYSRQQQALILTKEPLTVGTAGAGSGKSHTLVGRLEYLKEQGEDMTKVMVLSFTNTAADNITKRYPQIKSITLGNLFNQTYLANFPRQTLSTGATVNNALNLLNLDSQYFKQFKAQVSSAELKEVRDTLTDLLNQLEPATFKRVDIADVTARLSSFISDKLAAVVVLLNAIGQTTLDLQPIIIHAMLTSHLNLIIPTEFQNLNFIITDESQDISTFEYILLTTLTIMYRSNLMIIGDGSQTLYEFRNSNPQFLNAIEASGIFVSYKLTTNYRSNKAILMYANQFLSVIDANRYAKIQLQPASFQNIDTKDFRHSVKVLDMIMDSGRSQDYLADLKNFKPDELTDWVIEKYKKHEQIAIMAFTHKELDQMTENVTSIISRLGRKPIVGTLTPQKKRAKTLLSGAISRKKDDLASLPTQHHAAELKKLIVTGVTDQFRNPAKAFVPDYVTRAIDSLTRLPAYLTNLRLAQAGTINLKQLNGFVVQSLLNYEIHLNSVTSVLNQQANTNTASDSLDKADIITSTVHSAKGLEFPNTIVVYNEHRSRATSQEMLRLFGVALTRAKNNELIINAHLDSRHGSRTIDHNLTGMFKTPMSTAYARCLDDLTQLATPAQANG